MFYLLLSSMPNEHFIKIHSKASRSKLSKRTAHIESTSKFYKNFSPTDFILSTIDCTWSMFHRKNYIRKSCTWYNKVSALLIYPKFVSIFAHFPLPMLKRMPMLGFKKQRWAAFNGFNGQYFEKLDFQKNKFCRSCCQNFSSIFQLKQTIFCFL